MTHASRSFQVFAKPAGAVCNLGCHYCYYLEKEHLTQTDHRLRMADDILEAYIVQHIEASPDKVIRFSWHGGEPMLLGLDYFRNIVRLQLKHQPPGKVITNGIQTNGSLLDEDWCRFFSTESFAVGLSLDGPAELHDRYRVTRGQEPTHDRVMSGYDLLRRHRVLCDILCVVHAENVCHPTLLYRFFKRIGSRYIGFLPLVERSRGVDGGINPRSVPPDAWGTFLCTIFDEWLQEDIGRVKIRIFEEVAGTAFGQEPTLCIFRKTCGDVPVIERNGDFFSCDHFVDPEHRLGNIRDSTLAELLDSPAQRAFGESKSGVLPLYCRDCEVRDMCNGGCPKDRFLLTPDGEPGLNYLCAGYKRFFNHCKPFVRQLTALAECQPSVPPLSPTPGKAYQSAANTGRNDPCPCGSGRKYKKCCLGK